MARIDLMQREPEAAIGNLIADAVRISAGADAAVINGGSIRSNKPFPPGSTITRRDISKDLPFGNHIALIEISGRELKAAIENGLSALPGASGRFPQVSGLVIEAETWDAMIARATAAARELLVLNNVPHDNSVELRFSAYQIEAVAA